MKHILYLLFLFSTICYSQNLRYDLYDINFEDSEEVDRIFIDTISNPNNSWQIGQPGKTWLSDPKSPQNVIITDTLNSYPVNDSSIFLIRHVPQRGFENTHTVTFAGFYKVDSDTLVDYGKIEFSPNNGMEWIDLINGDIDPNYFFWSENKPVLTGRSDWTYFQAQLQFLGLLYDIADTVIYRFTFVSDTIDNQRDGMMFDDFHFDDSTEGIDDHFKNVFNSTVCPNPTSTEFTIKFDNESFTEFSVSIFNIAGEKVYNKFRIVDSDILVEASTFSPGIYFYILSSDKQIDRGKIIIE